VDVSFPGVVDWNNDGKKDVFCGEDSGKVNLLINEGSDADPLFKRSTYIQDGSSDLKVSMRANPVVADWNNDGKKDLIVGEEFGYLFYYENKGTDADPVFNGGVKMKADGKIIDVDSRARPDIADWDNDGVQDLLCGQDVWTPSHDQAHVIFFHALGPLSLSENAIPAGTGGSIDLALDAGAAQGNRNYLILGTASGTEPGYPLPGGLVTLPLNWDPITDVFLILVNTPVFPGFMATLSGSGTASAAIHAPALPPTSIGVILHFAYTMNNPFDYVSNGAAVEITP
jgi:hypothetical protein